SLNDVVESDTQGKDDDPRDDTFNNVGTLSDLGDDNTLDNIDKADEISSSNAVILGSTSTTPIQLQMHQQSLNDLWQIMDEYFVHHVEITSEIQSQQKALEGRYDSIQYQRRFGQEAHLQLAARVDNNQIQQQERISKLEKQVENLARLLSGPSISAESPAGP
ncbi:hypothetical protein BGX20_007196, partial [Mortierella sp. AD010]